MQVGKKDKKENLLFEELAYIQDVKIYEGLVVVGTRASFILACLKFRNYL